MEMQDKQTPEGQDDNRKQGSDRAAQNRESALNGSGSGSDDGTREIQIGQTRDGRLARLFALVTLLAVVLLVAVFVLGNLFLPETPPVAQPKLFKSPRIAMPERPGFVEPTEPSAHEATAAVQPEARADGVADQSQPEAQEVAVPGIPSQPEAKAATPQVRYTVVLGPFITESGLLSGETLLRNKGLVFGKSTGTGPVRLTRMLEGVYPPAVARNRVTVLQKAGVESAFVLRQGDKLAVYAGSYIDQKQAETFTRELTQKNIKVSWVETLLSKEGTLLTVENVPEATGHLLEQVFTPRGINVQLDMVE